MKTHNTIFKIFILISVVLATFSGAFLYLSGETDNLKLIAETQQKTGGLYGTAIHTDMFPYKLEIFKVRKPEIAAVGSSRVMEFNEDWFLKPFMTFGGAFRNLNEGEILFNETDKFKGIHVLLIGVEFWWFRPGPEQSKFPEHVSARPSVEESILKTYKWFYEGKINLNAFNKVFMKTFSGNSHDFGIQAIVSQVGFRRDGSYSYSGDVTKPIKNDFWSKIVSRIEDGVNGYEKSTDFDKNKYYQFIKLIEAIEAQGIKVVVFFPPMASKIARAMNTSDYAYVQKLKLQLQKDLKYFADYLDPTSIETNDCEFIDPQHGGETTYARLTNSLLKKFPDVMSSYIKGVDLDSIKNAQSFKTLDPKDKEYSFISNCPGLIAGAGK